MLTKYNLMFIVVYFLFLPCEFMLLIVVFHRQVPKRNSQQGKIGGSGNKGNKPAVRVSISVREDVKLRESDNAWKPVRFNPVVAATEEEQKTEVCFCVAVPI